MIRTLVGDPVLLVIVRVALAVLFASAAVHKLRDRGAFGDVLHAYRLLPERLVPATTAAIAAGELATAGALLTPHGGAFGVAGAVGLLVLYGVAIAINLARGRRTIDCGCGAVGARQPISEWLLVRNGMLAAAALATLVPPAPRPLGWVDWLTVAGAVALAAAVWTAAHGLAAAAARVRTAGAPS